MTPVSRVRRWWRAPSRRFSVALCRLSILHDLLYQSVRIAFFDGFWLTIYVFWFPVAVLGMVCFAVRKWEHFRWFAGAWLALFYVAIVPFLLLPTEPPWMHPGVMRIITEMTGDFADVDTNQVAAFPSLHVALPAMIALRARASNLPWMALAYGLFASLMTFAVVYLGEHFVIDAIAGVALAWVAVKIGERAAPATASEAADPDRVAWPDEVTHTPVRKAA
ncbi:MAG: phosphatase PAP2 family protein [Chloroflexi bacterium]|nr:phosphatase PAP2 family protein [Chloroflexota bacterium]MDA1147014.1 phosphatase PAP2 family protein [Chloroflexota bacterium]